jgi:hypothetical protein
VEPASAAVLGAQSTEISFPTTWQAPSWAETGWAASSPLPQCPRAGCILARQARECNHHLLRWLQDCHLSSPPSLPRRGSQGRARERRCWFLHRLSWTEDWDGGDLCGRASRLAARAAEFLPASFSRPHGTVAWRGVRSKEMIQRPRLSLAMFRERFASQTAELAVPSSKVFRPSCFVFELGENRNCGLLSSSSDISRISISLRPVENVAIIHVSGID